jgi:GTP cyclohydrolase I
VQERLTSQVANAIDEHLKPKGVGVVIEAVHLCMACRGVRKPADTVTSKLIGMMKKKAMRAEFLSLARE